MTLMPGRQKIRARWSTSRVLIAQTLPSGLNPLVVRPNRPQPARGIPSTLRSPAKVDLHQKQASLRLHRAASLLRFALRLPEAKNHSQVSSANRLNTKLLSLNQSDGGSTNWPDANHRLLNRAVTSARAQPPVLRRGLLRRMVANRKLQLVPAPATKARIRGIYWTIASSYPRMSRKTENASAEDPRLWQNAERQEHVQLLATPAHGLSWTSESNKGGMARNLLRSSHRDANDNRRKHRCPAPALQP